MTYSKLIIPVAFIYGDDAVEAVAQGQGLFWAGGKIAFTAAKIIYRGSAKLSFISTSDLLETSDDEFQQQLIDITAVRPNICGLSMATPHVMGILNITPDSFSDGGKQADLNVLEQNIDEYIRNGLTIVDIGAESTRPNASYVNCDAEIDRLKPVLKMLQAKNICISVDTRKAKVMQFAIENGAHIINDVSALEFRATDAQYGENSGNSEEIILKSGCPVILMHSQGTPEVMQDNPTYDDILFEIYDYLQGRIHSLVSKGLEPSKITIDPGIGFGKTARHCLEILNNLSLFHSLGVAVLLGASRKSFMLDIVNEPVAKNRLGGSLAAMNAGLLNGVHIHRMHDINHALQYIKISDAIYQG
ncbi:MAG: dihydropteroate synthase [Hyphomicrobiales bacterium]